MRRWDRSTPAVFSSFIHLSGLLATVMVGACGSSQPTEGESQKDESEGLEVEGEAPSVDPSPAIDPSLGAASLGGADWWAEVRERIDAGSRAFTPAEAGAFRSSRPGASALLDQDGIHATTGPGGGLHLRLSGVGRNTARSIRPGGVPVSGLCTEVMDAAGSCIRRVELHSDGLTEWWLATREGYEQGFVVEESVAEEVAAGGGPLRLEIAVEGARAELDGEAVALIEEAGPTWRYGDLHAWDADGRVLPAAFEVEDGQLHIVVDDRGARWPVEIDPVLSAGTTLSGSTVTGLGASVSGAGDINKDGYDDVIVGAPDDNSGAGRVYIFHGSSIGPARLASTTLSGSSAGSAFGTAVDGAGDVNADTYDDVIVGAPLASTSKGQVYIYHGTASGLSTTAARTLTGTGATEGCGSAVSSAGDYDNDGYGDVVYGCPAYSTNQGRAYVFKGTSTGIGASSAFSVTGSTTYYTGRTVGGGGDVSGDVYDDVIIGAYGYSTYRGRVYVYKGSATGLSGSARLTLSSSTNNEKFGYSLAYLGDTNGDGYGDFAVGAPGGSSGAGGVYVFHGASGGTTATSPSSANVTITGATTSDGIGDTVTSVGDVSGDTYSDLLYTSITASSAAGYAKLHLGSSSGISTTTTMTVSGSTAGDQEGYCVAGLGDTNNDGYDDLAVSRYSSSTTSASQVQVYLGASGGPSSTAAVNWSGAADASGSAVAIVGDVNNDGYDEIAVGAPSYGGSTGRVYIYHGSSAGVSSTASTELAGSSVGGTFGAALCRAGDVNHDGYDDIAVGAPEESSSVGVAYLFTGSSSGLSASRYSTLVGDTGSAFGSALSGGGDINGDNFDDLVVGGPSYSSSTGRAWVFHGATTGIETTAAQTLDGASSGDKFGVAVSVGGDINQDGYDEILVGASKNGTGSRGAAYLYHGSSSGVGSTATQTISGTATSQNLGEALSFVGDVNGDGFGDAVIGSPNLTLGTGKITLYAGFIGGLGASTSIGGAATSSKFGAAVAGAGDINNDGYDDVVVGAPISSSDNGAATVYHGTATGLNSTAATNISGADSSDLLGSSVGGGGDVNGDGYDDVVIGAPGVSSSSGSTYVHLGYAEDTDADGYKVDVDCDDNDAAINPGATEICDASDTDEDCSGQADVADSGTSLASMTVWYYDGDGDSYGGSASLTLCNQPPSYLSTGGDCNDSAVAINPAATEICDTANTDEDCDGLADNADSSADSGGKTSYYTDFDGDGYGSATATLYCDLPSGYSSLGTDCDDSTAIRSPGNTEVCDAADVDEDCDSLSDDADSSASTATMTRWYVDADGDSYGTSVSTLTCDTPTGYTAATGDCDDGAAGVNPGATEICDATDTDEDCDGSADNADSSASAATQTSYYLDDDGDGYGSSTSAAFCDLPAGYAAVGTDCDDTTSGRSPGNTELCDAFDVDEDCDLLSDSADSSASGATKTLFYLDSDGDAYGSTTTGSYCDLPSGYSTLSTDCDDTTSIRSPGNTEVCDVGDVDEDCDSLSDDADSSASATTMTTWYVDSDTDSYGSAVTGDYCDQPVGYSAVGGDCDDIVAAVNPAATEVCDAADTDEDCDGLADNGDSSASISTRTNYSLDEDGDGYGGSTTAAWCDLPAGYSTTAGDCDDTVAAVNPGASEVCDAADTDEDCDGTADNADSSASGATKTSFYLDGDSDGYGAGAAVAWCDLPSGYAALSGDCDDGTALINPGATELCDGANTDEDCDGTADNSDSSASSATKTTFYVDSDGDSYGTAATGSYCDRPSGYASLTGDCDDGAAVINPSATEVCDAADTDEDCDGSADNADSSTSAATRSTWYVDADGDSYGTSVTGSYCDRPTGFAALSGDCDDTLLAVNPGATEVCDAADTDEDCDWTADNADTSASAVTKSTWYRDGDEDGFGGSSSADFCDQPVGYEGLGTDCLDSDPTVFPGAVEGIGDGVDQDCDGSELCYVDADEDGYRVTDTLDSTTVDCSVAGLALASLPDGDCDDTSTDYNPGATEADCTDPNDYNCDGSTGYFDADGDGWAACAECDDTLSDVNPDAVELCDAANTDEDCDGLIDDADGSVDSTTLALFYADGDSDGYAGTSATLYCDAPAGYDTAPTDCDDADPAVNPGMAEICDGSDVDEDCDSLADDADPDVDGATWSIFFQDADSDGYGGTSTGYACDAPSGYVTTSTDCDDLAAGVNPGATELCDDADMDEDCDGLADDLDGSVSIASYATFYADSDGDGYGDALTAVMACDPSALAVSDDTDCDDTDLNINPGAVDEVADGIDSDCDGAESCYGDVDGDGWRTDTTVDSADFDCADPGEALESVPGGDCDDDDIVYHPGASEADCLDPADYNCDGSVGYADADLDGFAACEECDDALAEVNPDAIEICDGIDNNCDSSTDGADAFGAIAWEGDKDEDGFSNELDVMVSCDPPEGYGPSTDEVDCDDLDEEVNPDATELVDDELDQDCDGQELCYVDFDNDGYRPDETSTVSSLDTLCDEPGEAFAEDPTGDCDDNDAAAYPSAAEVAGDDIDQDCDGADLPADSGETDDTGPNMDDTGGDGGGQAGDDGGGDGGEDPGKGCGCATPSGLPTGGFGLLVGLLLVSLRRSSGSRAA